MFCIRPWRHCVKLQAGFTFVELIFVVVILGIVATIGSGYLVNTVDAYRTAQARSVLVQRARITLEQMSRQLRMSAPNSVRVSSSGRCIEFMPVVAGANYQGSVPDATNGRAPSSSVVTGSFNLGLGTPQHVLVAPLYDSEIYATGSPASRVGIGTLGFEPITSVPFAQNHVFIRNSVSRRLYLAADPERYCLNGDILYSYTGFGLQTGILSDANPGGNADILSHNISTGSRLFSLSPGSEDRSAAILMDLTISNGGNAIGFDHEVLVRNVP